MLIVMNDIQCALLLPMMRLLRKRSIHAKKKEMHEHGTAKDLF
jgi:hypothetical protein